MNRRIIIGVLLALALIVGAVGLGTTTYRAGVARGLAESGQPGEFLERGPEGIPGPYARGPFFYPRPFGFGFGFLGLLFPLLFILLLFGLLRGLFWRGHRGHWEKGAPPMFEEWHRRAHQTEAPPAEQEK